MTERPQIFAKEWRACLSAHYQSVVAKSDAINERSLSAVLTHLNFTDEELNDLRAAAIQGLSTETGKPIPQLAEISERSQDSKTTTLSNLLEQDENELESDDDSNFELEAAGDDASEEEITAHNEPEDDGPEFPQLSLFD